MQSTDKTIWQILWDYDPNGLVVVDPELRVQLANDAFCEMFHTTLDRLRGENLCTLMDDAQELLEVWENDEVVRGREKHYARVDLHAKKVMFAIKDQGLIACILVDTTRDWKQQQELRRLKEETLRNVDQVVDKQMKTAQEIASLLGETTAQTKVQMLKLSEMLKKGAL